MAGILEGVRVVSMENMEAIPATSGWLADWGAEVFKVEPFTGDIFRLVRTVTKIGGVDVNWEFQRMNRNKKGLALDLKKEPGRDILYKLVKRADVFVSNYRLGALERLKLDYDTLSQLNPKLVYALLSGYGSAGPDKDEPAFDTAAGWSRSGMVYLVGEPGNPPARRFVGMIDRIAAAHVVAGILAALLHREKTGKGQELEVSLFHSAVWTNAREIQGALVGSPVIVRKEALNNSYRTKDNQWLQLAMFPTDRYWPDLCRAIERPELENDPRFNTGEMRTENCDELIRIVADILASKTREEWERRFREHDCIYGRVQTAAEVTTDPQALANGFFVEMEYPAAGKIKLLASPVKFHQNPASVRAPAPELGQHTEEVLLELGYSGDDIARLKEQGVIL